MTHPIVPIPPAMSAFYDLPREVPFRFPSVETTRSPLVRLDQLATQLDSIDESSLVPLLDPTAREQIRLFRRDWTDIQLLERYLAIGNAAMARHLADRLVTTHTRRPVGHFGVGRVALLEGRWEEAVEAFRTALAHSGGSVEIQCELVLALAASGDVAGASDAVAEMNDTMESRSFRRLFGPVVLSGDRTALIERAALLGRFQSSRAGGPDADNPADVLAELTAAYPMEAPVLELAARAALDSGDFESARTLADRSTRLDREAMDGWLILSELALRSRDFPEAERTALMARRAAPDSRPALLALARVLLKDNRPAHAARILRSAGEQWPEDRTVRGLLASALLQSGDPAGAQAELEAAILRWPGDPLGWFHLGRVAETAGDLDRARSALAAAQSLADRFDEAREAAALLMARCGDADGARRDLLAMTVEYPDSPFGWRGLGDLALAERPAEAARFYAEALSRRPGLELAGAEHLAGLTELREGRHASAAGHFEAAVRLDPRRHEIWCGLGVALHGTGQPDGAIRAMREAVRLSPDQAGYHANLATFLDAAFRRNPLLNWRCRGMAGQSRRRAAELETSMTARAR